MLCIPLNMRPYTPFFTLKRGVFFFQYFDDNFLTSETTQASKLTYSVVYFSRMAQVSEFGFRFLEVTL